MIKNPPPSQTSRLARGVLIGSLALNFLIIGGAIGFILTADKHRQPLPSSFSIGPFTQALEDVQRQKIRENLKENMEVRRKNDWRESRRAFAAFLASLQQEPFERAKVVDALNAMEMQSKTRRKEGTDAYLDALESMTPQERSTYVERLEREVKKHRSRPKKTSPEQK
ncbi:periplasmic heavy metal sensor [Falsihalocynthiibacter arcticus]|uniref:Zinc resistance-associated protein n=1 Tax=Falsihalocynthiibacter arcticus TaxID=1579316 RepID=A0A126UZX1_9RHOB|nr:periplasmic heavy metal sensor [Falsihalocynthiibacter arcticus]AML51603.1 hypothetical protein RC74_10315 [Falsihalocynthiibacter arcticus]